MLQTLSKNVSFSFKPVCEQAIRIGDLFAPIIEFYYSQNNPTQAFQYLKVL